MNVFNNTPIEYHYYKYPSYTEIDPKREGIFSDNLLSYLCFKYSEFLDMRKGYFFNDPVMKKHWLDQKLKEIKDDINFLYYISNGVKIKDPSYEYARSTNLISRKEPLEVSKLFPTPITEWTF